MMQGLGVPTLYSQKSACNFWLPENLTTTNSLLLLTGSLTDGINLLTHILSVDASYTVLFLQ